MRRTDFKCKVLRLYAEFMPNSSFHVVSRLAYLPGSGRDLVGVFWNQAGTSTRDSPHLNVEPLNVELWVCLISWWLVEPSDHLEGTKNWRTELVAARRWRIIPWQRSCRPTWRTEYGRHGRGQSRGCNLGPSETSSVIWDIRD